MFLPILMMRVIFGHFNGAMRVVPGVPALALVAISVLMLGLYITCMVVFYFILELVLRMSLKVKKKTIKKNSNATYF